VAPHSIDSSVLHFTPAQRDERPSSGCPHPCSRTARVTYDYSARCRTHSCLGCNRHCCKISRRVELAGFDTAPARACDIPRRRRRAPRRAGSAPVYEKLRSEPPTTAVDVGGGSSARRARLSGGRSCASRCCRGRRTADRMPSVRHHRYFAPSAHQVVGRLVRLAVAGDAAGDHGAISWRT
jgi:hypothetical protein